MDPLANDASSRRCRRSRSRIAVEVAERKKAPKTHKRKKNQMASLEEAKAFLKKESENGSSLYDHLSEVLLKILVERPENLSDSFEHLSTVVKQQRYVSNQTTAGESAASAAEKEAVRLFSLVFRC